MPDLIPAYRQAGGIQTSSRRKSGTISKTGSRFSPGTLDSGHSTKLMALSMPKGFAGMMILMELEFINKHSYAFMGDEMTGSMILLNGNILTFDSKNRRAEAVAVVDGKIAMVGTDEQIRGQYGKGCESIDLHGRTVLPGFIDSHVHLIATAVTAIGINLGETRGIDEVLAEVAERVRQTPPGKWILGYFITYLSDRGMPTRFDLDRVSKDHPIRVTHRNGHLCSLNTKALEILTLPTDLEGVERVSGDITGVIRDPAIQALPHPGLLLDEEMKRDALMIASQSILEKGVTTLHSLDGSPRNPGAIPLLLKIKDKLPIKLVLYNQTMEVKECLALGLPRIGGCISADGAFESHTAALFEPYADEPDNYGTLTYTSEQMCGFISKAHQAGLQIAVHCEADRAIEQVLFGYEKALRHSPREDHRHRIEHFEVPTENQVERVARAGIVTGMQPSFLPAFFFRSGEERYEAFLGRSRLKRIHPYRSMLSYGILMAGGSDSPVTKVDPLSGIEAAATHPHLEERLPILEAIKLFTINGARFAFEEDRKGSIEAGKAADLVILSQDPCSIAPEKIGKISIEMTLVDGKITFKNRTTSPLVK
jgi:predicted amidohydrolase YtcJ